MKTSLFQNRTVNILIVILILLFQSLVLMCVIFQNRNNVLVNIELANHKKSVDDYRFMRKTMLLEKNTYFMPRVRL